MKLKILATGIAPDYYTIDGDVITAHVGGVSDSYDLSQLKEGDTVTSVGISAFEVSEPQLSNTQVIRMATRESGVLIVALCQQVGPGYWTESDWIDAADYDPDAVYAQFDETRGYAGTPWVKTRLGKMVFNGEFNLLES